MYGCLSCLCSRTGSARADELVLRAAVSAYLGRYRGRTRLHTESDLRVFLRWCTDQDLHPLAAVRVYIEGTCASCCHRFDPIDPDLRSVEDQARPALAAGRAPLFRRGLAVAIRSMVAVTCR